MAVLNPSDAGVLWNQLYRLGSGKEETKAHANLPSQTQIYNAWQVLEDFWENNKATVKASIDAALGYTTTAAEAKKWSLQFLIWKASKGG